MDRLRKDSKPGASSIFIANRGDVAIRVTRCARALGLRSVVAVIPSERSALHAKLADEVAMVPSYSDGAALIAAALEHKCFAVHPGWGFLSEDAAFAQSCVDASLVWVGCSPRVLALFGDKLCARQFVTEQCFLYGVRTIPGSETSLDLRGTIEFARAHAPAELMLKAVEGGGGRGIRKITVASGGAEDVAEITSAFKRCVAEAGATRVFVERCVADAMHIEVQLAGNGSVVRHIGTRDCTLQRSRQKVIEIAPAPSLSAPLRARLLSAALAIGRRSRLDSLATVEFLLVGESVESSVEFYFLEVNPRLQVEHTVTEEAFGVDLVRLQFALAGVTGALGGAIATGADALCFMEPSSPPRYAVEARVCMETMRRDGGAIPAHGGAIQLITLPTGCGLRIDSCAFVGLQPSIGLDTLLLKLVAVASTKDAALRRLRLALQELAVVGVETNISFLRALVNTLIDGTDGAAIYGIHTLWIEKHATMLVDAADRIEAATDIAARAALPPATPAEHSAFTSMRIQPSLHAPPPGAIVAPLASSITELCVRLGETVARGTLLAVLLAMKMEHEVRALEDGVVGAIFVKEGDSVALGDMLLRIEVNESSSHREQRDRPAASAESESESMALRELEERLDGLSDASRFARDVKFAKRSAQRLARGQRSARRNIADLCGFPLESWAVRFHELGALTVAAQRCRRSVEDLIDRTPADGMVCGLGEVNGLRTCVASYDYTVLAGTQGYWNHKKLDRLVAIAEQSRLPLVLFAEGGGGRPGDDDALPVSGGTLVCSSFRAMARLSALVPLVAIVSGRCFAGNAALAGCCDVIIAVRGANLAMAGPAMIEGGGLGIVAPSALGPVTTLEQIGVVDVVVENDADAVEFARRYLSFFQTPMILNKVNEDVLLTSSATAEDFQKMIPANRRRVFDVRRIIAALCDDYASKKNNNLNYLELRPAFGKSIVTALGRIEGRSVGIIASDSQSHLGGAIDSDSADSCARFITLCDAFALPIVSLIDCPGFNVGETSELSGAVRRMSALFLAGATASVPIAAVVLRRAYGLGAMAMAGGAHQHGTLFTATWPSGEFGGMGLEGAVRLAYKKQLAAIEDEKERTVMFETMVAMAKEHGSALNNAMKFEVDAVIDPAQTREWIARAFAGLPHGSSRAGGKRRPSVL